MPKSKDEFYAIYNVSNDELLYYDGELRGTRWGPCDAGGGMACLIAASMVDLVRYVKGDLTHCTDYDVHVHWGNERAFMTDGYDICDYVMVRCKLDTISEFYYLDGAYTAEEFLMEYYDE